MLSRTISLSTAVAAGMLLAGEVLAVPGATAPVTSRAGAWGSNAWSAGQLGNNSTTNSPVPVAVDTSGVLAGKTVTAITAGMGHTCAIADGRAYCWGWNYSATLGNNSTTNSLVPVAVDTSGALSGKTVTAISAGWSHTCAIADGRAYCWGRNYTGEIGNNSTTDSLVPVAVDTSGALSGKTVTAISAGNGHTCALANGKVYCWGANGNGQLGDNTTTTYSAVPVAVDTSGALHTKKVTAISAGGSHTCVLADGRAYCWGYNRYGGLGNHRTAKSLAPVAVNTSGVLHTKKVTAISAGGFHSCVIAGGRAYCWGKNYRGELGNNRTGKSKVPVAVDTSGVLHNKKVTAISANVFHTCALADGRALCWGRNNRGELGDSSWTKSSVPVAVDTTGVLRNQTVTAISAGRRHTAVLFRPTPRR